MRARPRRDGRGSRRIGFEDPSHPVRLLAAATDEKVLADFGTAGIEQHAFAGFLARHRRRDLLIDDLTHALPEATVRGIAAGLHATVELPEEYEEQALLDQAGAGGPP